MDRHVLERLTCADDVRAPQSMPLAAAQDCVAFVVFEPGWLPVDLAASKPVTTVRLEMPPGRPDGVEWAAMKPTPWSIANPSAIRTEWRGARAIRMKQFVYDWAPPAASIAPLWESPQLSAVACGDTVGWIGTDYREAAGACVERCGTQIEFSVVDGSFANDELRGLLQGLQPVRQAFADGFVPRQHRDNYWIRYGLQPLRTPHGLFVYGQRRAYDADCRALDLASAAPLPWRCASAIEMRAGDGHVDQERVFLHADNPDAWAIWSRINADSPRAFQIPPQAETPPIGYRSVWSCHGIDVHVAAIDRSHGAWEARWRRDDSVNAVWTSASRLWDEAMMRSFVDAVTGHADHGDHAGHGDQARG